MRGGKGGKQRVFPLPNSKDVGKIGGDSMGGKSRTTVTEAKDNRRGQRADIAENCGSTQGTTGHGKRWLMFSR